MHKAQHERRSPFRPQSAPARGTALSEEYNPQGFAREAAGKAGGLSRSRVLWLQSTAGNLAVARLLHAAPVQRAVEGAEDWIPPADKAQTDDIKWKHVVPSADRPTARAKLAGRLPDITKSTIFQMTGEQAQEEIRTHLNKGETTVETLTADKATTKTYPMSQDYPVATAALSEKLASPAEKVAKISVGQGKPKLAFDIRDFRPPPPRPGYKAPAKRSGLTLYHVTGTDPEPPAIGTADRSLVALYKRDPLAALAQVAASDTAEDVAAAALLKAAADAEAEAAEAKRLKNQAKYAAKAQKAKAAKTAAKAAKEATT